MAPKPSNWKMYSKMAAMFLGISIGGPALVYYVSPTEEELFLKYNPELQKRSLQNRVGRQQDFDDFVTKLKEYSKSDRSIWEVAAEAERKANEDKVEAELKAMEEKIKAESKANESKVITELKANDDKAKAKQQSSWFGILR